MGAVKLSRGYQDDRLEILRRLLLIRQFEERALELRASNEIHGVIHPYVGQEAIAVGVCSVLSPTDRIISTHRGHGHCIAKGARVDRMMAELFGREDGYCRGKGGSMHIAAFDVGMLGANGIVGGGLPIALGSALAAKMDDADVVTVAFFGDGATGEGAFHESLNLSALWALPVIWVCENNQFASETPVSESIPGGRASGFAEGYRLPAVSVDGNDVDAVSSATASAVERALEGAGPTLIEANTFRLRMHATRQHPPPEMRDPALLRAWEANDPIPRFQRLLEERQAMSAMTAKGLREEVDQEIDAAVRFARRSPYPRADAALEDVWSE